MGKPDLNLDPVKGLRFRGELPRVSLHVMHRSIELPKGITVQHAMPVGLVRGFREEGIELIVLVEY